MPISGYTFTSSQVSVRFRAPYITSSINQQYRGILAAGVYEGFSPVPSASPLILRLAAGDSGRSSAVVPSSIDPEAHVTVRLDGPLEIDLAALSGKTVAVSVTASYAFPSETSAVVNVYDLMTETPPDSDCILAEVDVPLTGTIPANNIRLTGRTLPWESRGRDATPMVSVVRNGGPFMSASATSIPDFWQQEGSTAQVVFDGSDAETAPSGYDLSFRARKVASGTGTITGAMVQKIGLPIPAGRRVRLSVSYWPVLLPASGSPVLRAIFTNFGGVVTSSVEIPLSSTTIGSWVEYENFNTLTESTEPVVLKEVRVDVTALTYAVPAGLSPIFYLANIDVQVEQAGSATDVLGTRSGESHHTKVKLYENAFPSAANASLAFSQTSPGVYETGLAPSVFPPSHTFRVSGNAIVEQNFTVLGTANIGAVSGNTLDTNPTPPAAFVQIGTVNATGVNISRVGATTAVKGSLRVDEALTVGSSLDVITPGVLNIGATATEIHVGSVGVNTIVEGNIVVKGTTYSSQTENVLVEDSHIYLNSGWVTPTVRKAGLVVNYEPTPLQTQVAGAYTVTAGVSTVTTVGTATFATGDVIQISSSKKNDGLYVVETHVGTTLTIESTAPVSDQWFQTSFTADANDSAVITKVNVALLRADGAGSWEIASGSTVTDINTSATTLATTSGGGGGGGGGTGSGGEIAFFDNTSTLTSSTKLVFSTSSGDSVINAQGTLQRNVAYLTTTDTGISNQLAIKNNSNVGAAVLGTVSSDGTLNGDVFGLGVSSNPRTADFNPYVQWDGAGDVGIGLSPRAATPLRISNGSTNSGIEFSYPTGLPGTTNITSADRATGNLSPVILNASTFRIQLGSTTGSETVVATFIRSGVVGGYTHTLGIGGPDGSAPGAGTIKSSDATTGTNIAGAELRVRGGTSTGSGVGGSVTFQVSPSGAAGSSINSPVTRASISDIGFEITNPQNRSHDVLISEQATTNANKYVGIGNYGSTGSSTDIYIGTGLTNNATTYISIGSGNSGTSSTTVEIGNARASNTYIGTSSGGVANQVAIGNGNTTLTLAGATIQVAASNLAGSNIVVTADAQTLQNKTLTNPVIKQATGSASVTLTTPASPVSAFTLTLPAATDTLVGKDTTDTLTNKTLGAGCSIPLAQVGNTNANVRTWIGSPSSANLYAAMTDKQGTGGGLVFANSPSLTTPNLGVATATSINKVTITAPSTSATLTIANGKTLTVNNNLTLGGTDGSSIAFGGGGTVAYTGNKLNQFASPKTTTAELSGVITEGSTGTGKLVLDTSPTVSGANLTGTTSTFDVNSSATTGAAYEATSLSTGTGFSATVSDALGTGFRFDGVSSSTAIRNSTSNFYTVTQLVDATVDRSGNVTGTVTSATSNSLTNSAATFGSNSYASYTVFITTGLGVGQSRVISSNTNTVLTVSPNWTTIPDTTSTYLIVNDTVSTFSFNAFGLNLSFQNVAKPFAYTVVGRVNLTAVTPSTFSGDYGFSTAHVLGCVYLTAGATGTAATASAPATQRLRVNFPSPTYDQRVFRAWSESSGTNIAPLTSAGTFDSTDLDITVYGTTVGSTDYAVHVGLPRLAVVHTSGTFSRLTRWVGTVDWTFRSQALTT